MQSLATVVINQKMITRVTVERVRRRRVEPQWRRLSRIRRRNAGVERSMRTHRTRYNFFCQFCNFVDLILLEGNYAIRKLFRYYVLGKENLIRHECTLEKVGFSKFTILCIIQSQFQVKGMVGANMMDPYSAFAPHNRSSPESQYSGFPLMMSSGPIGPSGGNYEYRNISPVTISNYESFALPKSLVRKLIPPLSIKLFL